MCTNLHASKYSVYTIKIYIYGSITISIILQSTTFVGFPHGYIIIAVLCKKVNSMLHGNNIMLRLSSLPMK